MTTKVILENIYLQTIKRLLFIKWTIEIKSSLSVDFNPRYDVKNKRVFYQQK